MTDEARTPHPAAAEKLKEAARLVAEAITDLDRTSALRACCGAKHWNHYGDYRAALELEAVEIKLLKWAAACRAGITRTKTETDK